MRYLKMCLILGVLGAFSVQALGLNLLPNTPQKGKYSDYGSFYSVPVAGVDPYGRAYQTAGLVPRPGQTAEPLANPAGAFIPVFPGDELRNTFLITSIDRDILPNPAGFDFADSAAEQLAGMLYDLDLISTSPSPLPVGGGTLYLGDKNRNGIVARPALTGGVLEIWRDTSLATTFDPTAASPDAGMGAGPGAWDEADFHTHIAGAFGHAAGPDGFPTINQEGQELLLQMVFIPFPETLADPVPAGTLLRETVTGLTSTSTGEGSAYLMVTGGSYAPQIQPGSLNADYIADGGYLASGALPLGITADVFVQFDLKPDEEGAPPWGNVSEDPFRFKTIVPEPFTMVAVAMSLVGLGGYVRKRLALV